MNKKLTFVLMLVFMALGTLAFFDPFGARAKKEAAAERAGHVFSVEGEKLKQIVIKRGTESYALACRAEGGCAFDGTGEWNLLAPVQDRADDSAVGSLLASIKNLAVADRIALDAPADPHEFGFPEAALSVELTGVKAGQVYKLTLGVPAPTSQSIYAQANVEQNTIYLVGPSVAELLKNDLYYWRNKRLFPDVKGDKIEALGFTGGTGPAVQAVRGPDGWRLNHPVAAPANQVLFDGLASTVGYAAAKSVYTGGARPGPKAKPRREISFGAGGSASHTLKLYSVKGLPEGTLLAAASGQLGQLYVVDSEPFARFDKTMREYRDGHLFPGVELLDATRLELKFPRENVALSLRKQGEGWAAAPGSQLPDSLSAERIQAFFEALQNAEAVDYSSGPRPEVARFRKGPIDLELGVYAGERQLGFARFQVSEKKFAITGGVSDAEVRRFAGPLVAALPVRLSDLYASSNQTVVTQPPEGGAHGSQPGHSHAH